MAIVDIWQIDDCDLSLEDFIADDPFASVAAAEEASRAEADGLIHQMSLRRLGRNNDRRGHLTVLFSKRTEEQNALVHVYQVHAYPGAVRAWVYHRHQRDRLCFTQGRFQIAVFDLRPESPTFRRLNLIEAGFSEPAQIEIPPFVVHGVYNAGTEAASFINMPTRAWRADAPDKCRIPYPDPRLPFAFGR